MLVKTKIIDILTDLPAKFQTSDVLNVLDESVTRQHISRILQELVTEGQLLTTGGGKYTYYSLPENAGLFFQKTYKNKESEEDRVFHEVIESFSEYDALSPEVQAIFAYTFTKMFNNAIDHSESKDIQVTAHNVGKVLSFTIRDYGIGIFNSIKSKYKLDSEQEAMLDLLKGKTTTAPEVHSGEGIFFSSKVARECTIQSFDHGLKVDNIADDVYWEDRDRTIKGTKVTISIDTTSKISLVDVFKRYESVAGSFLFDKTSVMVKLYARNTKYISRSQARWLLSGLDKFNEIVLDFKEVTVVGQGFVDEIFRVFQAKHPNIKLEPVHMSSSVKFMVDRVDKDSIEK